MLNVVRKFEQYCDRLREIFSHSAALLLAALILIVWRLVLSSPADPDLFSRISMGRLVDKLGAVPLHDPFSFTAKLPLWIDHEWLSGVVFYQVGLRWGDAGFVLLKLFMAAWTCLLLVRASILYTPQAAGRMAWMGVCILEASFLWGSTIRCQVFTYFVIALIYYAFAQYRVKGVCRYLLLIPVSSVALVNMHGGYALEVLVLWLLAVSSLVQGERWKLLAVVAALSSLAPALTPYGFESFVTYLVHALTMERPSISEWFALYRDPAAFLRVSLIVTPLVVGIFAALRNRQRDLTALALLCFSFYCGVKHIRFLGFAMLTAMVFGAGYFGRVVELLRHRLTFRMVMVERCCAVVGAVMFAVMSVQIAAAFARSDSWRLDTRIYPVEAAEWLRRSGATGRLLVDFNNGSFAQWRLYPRFLVSIDGRYEEVYTDDTVKDVGLAFSPHTLQGAAALQRIAPTHILFHALDVTPDVQSSLLSEWREVYRDDRYVIYSTIVDHPNPRITPTTTSSSTSDLWDPLF